MQGSPVSGCEPLRAVLPPLAGAGEPIPPRDVQEAVTRAGCRVRLDTPADLRGHADPPAHRAGRGASLLLTKRTLAAPAAARAKPPGRKLSALISVGTERMSACLPRHKRAAAHSRLTKRRRPGTG
jgi:hypothetical protein